MYGKDLELLRVTRAATLRLTAGLSQEQSEYSPGPGRWSVGEVLDHLLLSEKLYRDVFERLIGMQKSGQRAVISMGFSEVNTSIAFIPKFVMSMSTIPFTVLNLFIPPLVREMMTEFRVLPALNPDIARPRKGKAIGELREALQQSFEQTQALFHANPDLDYRRMRYRHPLMGNNHVPQVLRIVAFHERRHQSQIQDVLRSRQFPKAA